MIAHITAAVVLGIATSASLSQGQPSPVIVDEPAKPVPAKVQEEVKSCKRIVPTGSIMAKRFCFTKKDWREFDARTAEGAEGFLARRSAGSPVDRD